MSMQITRQWQVTMREGDAECEHVYAYRCGVQEAGELFFADEDDNVIAIFAPRVWFKVERVEDDT